MPGGRHGKRPPRAPSAAGRALPVGPALVLPASSRAPARLPPGDPCPVPLSRADAPRPPGAQDAPPRSLALASRPFPPRGALAPAGRANGPVGASAARGPAECSSGQAGRFRGEAIGRGGISRTRGRRGENPPRVRGAGYRDSRPMYRGFEVSVSYTPVKIYICFIHKYILSNRDIESTPPM